MLKTDSVMDGYLNGILPSKLRLDQLYTRHHGGGSLRSFLLDLDILFWTFLVFIPPARTLQPPEVDLFWGPISRLARRYLNWFIVDTAITFSALGISGVFWRSFGPLDVGWSRAIPLAIGFAFLFSLTGAILGVNRIAWSHANASDALDLLPAVALATAAALAVNRFLVPLPQLPAGLILMAAFLASLGFVIVRYRERLLSGMAARWLALRGGAQVAQERVLILGGGSAGQFIAWMLGRQIEMNFFRVVGFVDDDMYKQGSRIRGFRVLGRRDDIPRLVSQHDIGIIIFAIHNVSDGERKALLDICASTPARLVILPDILGELRAVVQGENIEAAKYNVNGIQEQQVDTWLAELEALAKGGEYIKLEESIRRYRSRLAGYG